MVNSDKTKENHILAEETDQPDSVTIRLAEIDESEEELLSLDDKSDTLDCSQDLVRSNCFSDSYLTATNGGALHEDILLNSDPIREVRGPVQDIVPLISGSDPTAEINLQNVQGRDDRILVRDVSKIPARTIGLLKFETERGGTRYGTAWLIGPRTLVTAGHNLLHKDTGETTVMHVGMAYDGRSPRGGWHRVTAAEVPSEWRNNPVPENPEDYAVIKIANPKVGNTLGWLGFADYEDRKFQDMILNVFGYPMDKPGYHLYGSTGRVTGINDDRLAYDCDAGPGMSGGPVIARFNNSRIVVGIHVAGWHPSNFATRIDGKAFRLFRKFQSW